ncbi:di-heme oxidoredictase family protein [Pseudoalteromonas sp. S3431]|uniref:di-heme oxidoredictase family protein n=1 Tax=Pseudoalteromonas sp. S3431 TaxID=579537 RepID=UPI0004A03DD3|nr:di-heme oxidoredictase family protein [Pseudoalteromonas sp. S3431]KDC55556.1 beta-glucanase [Pseudoalteromonas sp. S3431]
MKKKILLTGLAILLLCPTIHANAAIGNLIWEENFNTLDDEIWTVDVGDGCDQGLCGWGNQELQWYAKSNAYIDNIPNEAGNKALILEARDEASNGYAFTSGKVQTSNKIAVKYGMIEVRMMVPDVGIGLWPAAWLLGTTNQSWPAKGEIDMMEMGHKAQARVDAGFPGADINSYVGSNLIFYTDDACSDGNPTCAASIAWQNDNAHVSNEPLTNRFVTYRTYWTDSQIRFTVEDNGVEIDMFDAPFTITDESSEFQAPFYLLLNLAVGGNFTDAITNNQVTAIKPAKMYVDYVRVYELDGQGEVFIGDQTVPENGSFGIYTDTTETNNQLEIGTNADIFVWNTQSITAGDEPPFEGGNVISWDYVSENEWFGAGVQARQVRNLSNFTEDGVLSFKIKIPADVSFKIGIEDTYTNINWIEFPANEEHYGLIRDGQWSTVNIPVNELRGELIALQSLKGLFYITSLDNDLPKAPFEMAIDDIVWLGGNTTSNQDDTDNDGVLDTNDICPNTQPGKNVDNNGCHIITAQSVRIEAEDYTNYYDKTPINIGGEYRDDAVDIRTTTDQGGGYNVGWIEPEEFLDYTLNLGAGTYDINARVASAITGSFTLSIDGEAIATGVTATEGWHEYETLFLNTVELEASQHTLTITAQSGSFNFNWLELTLIEPEIIDTVIDSDNDGVLDAQDQCTDTLPGSVVDEAGCKIIQTNILDIEITSQSSLDFVVNLPDWADVHYFVNEGTQRNFRMANNGNNNTRSLTGLNDGDQIIYSFTYLDSDYRVKTSPWFNLVFSSTAFTNNGGDDNGDNGGDNGDDNSSNGDNDSNNGDNGSNNGADNPLNTDLTSIVPLFNANTVLEQAISFDRGDALVTRFADRGRDRHAKEDQFQAYDHYLSHYWTHRTAQFELADYVAKGGSTIEITFITEWKLGAKELRAWYRGLNTVAEYHGNLGGNVVELDNGSYDHNFNKISNDGDQYRYHLVIDRYRPLNWSASDNIPLAVGQRMEFEVSQFLDGVPEGRENYYGTTYLYIIGEGLVPWKTVGEFEDSTSEREDSYPIAEHGRLGGGTTLPYNYTAESDNHFMQMATNLSNINGQTFVKGRRVHHTNFKTGGHDESVENGIFAELAGKAGPNYVNASCAGCHQRNGRASVADVGEPLDKWVFAIADENGQPDPLRGYILQSNNIGINSALGEGTVKIASWTENNGLRSPNYEFSKGRPARFSARLAPQLVGLGLLEAISEETILEREDEADLNGDGISGKARLSTDPITGETRLGRFGYKGNATSIMHQVAGALNTDMGVMTSVLPTPDCGPEQTTCGNNTGSELADEHLNDLVKYVSLLGVRAQRDLDDSSVILGETIFNETGCESCHRSTMKTSEFAVHAELRSQTIRPFTDLLLHDMGEGLADNLGGGNATGAEWRTAPLWGLGLSACVTAGVTNPTGYQGDDVCTPDANYLHDGRARTINEAIMWHGGEAEQSRIAYESLSNTRRSALLAFLNSL